MVVARGEGGEGTGKIGKGNEEVKLPVTKEISHRDGKYSTGNNVAITLHGDRWGLCLPW